MGGASSIVEVKRVMSWKASRPTHKLIVPNKSLLSNPKINEIRMLRQMDIRETPERSALFMLSPRPAPKVVEES